MSNLFLASYYRLTSDEFIAKKTASQGETALLTSNMKCILLNGYVVITCNF